jgi:hypothetical protein
MGLRIGAALTHRRRMAFVRIRRRRGWGNELFGCRFHVLGCKWYRYNVALRWNKLSCRIRCSVLGLNRIVRPAIDLADTGCVIGTVTLRAPCCGHWLGCGASLLWLGGRPGVLATVVIAN